MWRIFIKKNTGGEIPITLPHYGKKRSKISLRVFSLSIPNGAKQEMNYLGIFWKKAIGASGNTETYCSADKSVELWLPQVWNSVFKSG
jgi:hypothetical protein